MSGGSMNYLYGSVRDVAHTLERSTNPKRRAFAAVLHRVSKALHDIEWVDSGDYGPGDEYEAIDAVVTPVDEANAAADKLREAIANAESALARLNLNTEST